MDFWSKIFSFIHHIWLQVTQAMTLRLFFICWLCKVILKRDLNIQEKNCLIIEPYHHFTFYNTFLRHILRIKWRLEDNDQKTGCLEKYIEINLFTKGELATRRL